MVNTQHIQTNRFKARILSVLTLALCGVMLSWNVSNAQIFAPDACDPEYYNSLEQRAWLEAQREITQNQNLIFKGDSVLEYTCFDDFLGVLAQQGGRSGGNRLFTGNNRWGNPASDLQGSLRNVSGAAIREYLDSNFDHDLLGGRDVGNNYAYDANIAAGAYNCRTMNDVWMLAKCMDFIDEPAEDGFFTFAEYAADPDKRFLPTRCPTAGAAFYQTPLDEALTDTVTPWVEDEIVTHYDLIFPANGCGIQQNGAGGAAGDPRVSVIRTGLIVKQNVGILEYEENVCVVPGCHYVPSSRTNGTCVSF